MKYQNIEIIRSDRRKRTIQAKDIQGKLHIYLPSGMNEKEENKWIDKMLKRMEKQKKKQSLNSEGLLADRAQEMNRKYFGGKLKFEIKYVTNQNSRFGSCTPKKKTIRVSDRIADTPHWVRDYIIIHELAHLVYPNHSKKFWELVNQYRFAERARGYLIAVGMSSDEEVGGS